jgi:sigma-B regulation protein RsbU (phosphoserine phosphatase)
MAVLRTIKGSNPGQVFPLVADVTVLGRHPDCDIILDIGAVSREHARVVRRDEDYYVEDLCSRNGTYLNDTRVEGQVKLSQQAQLRICDMVFEVLLGTGKEQPPDAGVQAGYELVDEDQRIGSSTIMSKVDVSSGAAGLRITANAEVKLRALLEISRDLGRTVRLGEVLPKLLDNLFAIFLQADRGFIVLKEAKTGKLIPKAIKHRREDSDEPLRISRTILEGVMATKEAILSADAATDSRFDMSESIVNFQIRSMMCAPLMATDGDVLGVLQLDTRDQRRRFLVDDLEVLAAVACLAAVVVENAQLHEIAIQEEAIRRELSLAHKVQQGFLPAAPPTLVGYEFFDFYEPANVLGGDYFDYIPLPGNRLAIVVADVSGKGVPAALLMARLSSEMRYSLLSRPTPAQALEHLNAFFCEGRWEDRFITVLLMVLDLANFEITCVNAGHLPPVLKEARAKVADVGESSSGLPIGIHPTSYSEFHMTLAPGDCLIAYTDGITEAMNERDECYGHDRVCTQLDTSSGDAAALGRQLLVDVRRFTGNRAQSDDMCLVCLRRAP